MLENNWFHCSLNIYFRARVKLIAFELLSSAEIITEVQSLLRSKSLSVGSCKRMHSCMWTMHCLFKSIILTRQTCCLLSVPPRFHTHTHIHLEWKLNLLNAAHHSIASGRLVALGHTLSASSIVNYRCVSIDQSIDWGVHGTVNCRSSPYDHDNVHLSSNDWRSLDMSLPFFHLSGEWPMPAHKLTL